MFSYRGIDGQGKPVESTLEAVDRKQVVKKLRSQRIKPIEIKEGKRQGRKSKLKKEAVSEKNELESSSASFFSRFQKGDKLASAFFAKLLQLHASGMPLGDAVNLMSQRVTSPVLKEVTLNVYKDLSEGRNLAVALRQMPDTFDDMMGHLIEAGEATGNLKPILENLIKNLEEKAALKKKIQSAMAYPILICTVALGVVALFLFFLLPRIETMMASLGGELNIAARLMIGLSDFALTEGPFVVLGLIVALVAYVKWRQTEDGRRHSDRLLLKIPIIKSLYFNSDICRMTNVMSILLGNGVNTTESLRLSENTLLNRTVLARFQASRTLINDGATFSVAFGKHHLLPESDIDILSIGENTGSVVNSFQEIYKTHAAELEAKLKLGTNLIAGCALGFAFALVFVLTLGIVTSILQLSKSLMAG